MSIADFKWWLSDAISTAIRSLAEKIWTALETKIFAVFRAARIGWAPESGLEIFWADTNIKPKVESALKRAFLQNYANFLKTAGTTQDEALLMSFFSLAYVYAIDMRDHPLVSHLYPYQVIRYWVPPGAMDQEADIRHILGIAIPARCTKHYQLLPWHESEGFGRTPFGRRFGR
jgi:hypothetical protein